MSWMIAWSCTGFIIGVILAREWSVFLSVAWLLTGISLCLLAAQGMRLWLVPIAIVGGLTLGLWRGSDVQHTMSGYKHVVGTNVAIYGTVSEDVDRNQRGQLVLRLRNVHIENKPIAGSMWVTLSDDATIRRSDIVFVHGKISKGFGNFAASMYSADVRKVKRPVPGDVALEVRDHFASGVRAAIDDPEASLGLGYLVGQRRGLPEELDTALQAAGLMHIVVASGYNLTILVRLARRLFERVSKYLSLITSAGMIIGFIAITGLSPSMSRAGLVAGLSLLAWYYGRRFHPLVLLPLAMAITLIVQPSYAWGDLGWQLSFAAFGGVMILAPLVQAYLFGDRPERTLRRIFIETIAATITTLPILLAAFGQFSVVAPIANMAILPFVPLAMLATFVAGVGGLLVPVFASIIGYPAQLILTYMTSMAQQIGGVPWALQEVSVGPMAVTLSYGLILVACIYMHRVTHYSLRASSLIE